MEVKAEKSDLRECSFCGGMESHEEQFIATLNTAICDACLNLCNQVAAGRKARRELAHSAGAKRDGMKRGLKVGQPKSTAIKSPKTIGEKIATARVQMGMTQDSLSKLLSVHRGTIARWEAGYSFPSRNRHLIKVFNALKIKPSELFTEDQSV